MRTEFVRLFYSDNTRLNPGTAGDLSASDELATINGGASAGEKVQRVKAGWGDEGDFKDTRLSQPFPVTAVDNSATGTISAADVVVGVPAEDGVPVTGVPTANSAVFCKASVGGDASFIVQLLGTPSGTFWFEISFDSTNGTDGNWIIAKSRQAGHTRENDLWKTKIKGVYRGNLAGATYVRVRNTGGNNHPSSRWMDSISCTSFSFIKIKIRRWRWMQPRSLACTCYPCRKNITQVNLSHCCSKCCIVGYIRNTRSIVGNIWARSCVSWGRVHEYDRRILSIPISISNDFFQVCFKLCCAYATSC